MDENSVEQLMAAIWSHQDGAPTAHEQFSSYTTSVVIFIFHTV